LLVAVEVVGRVGVQMVVEVEVEVVLVD